MIQSGYGSCRCRRSLYILARRWRNAVCNRCVCISSIRRRSCLSAQRYICRYRIQTCLELSASWIVILLKRFGICIGNFSCKIINFRNIISKFRNFIDHIVDFFESLCLLFTRFHPHESFQKSFCSGSIHISACFLHCLHDHLCHITGGLRIQSFIIVPCKSFLKFFHRYFLILIDQFADCKKSICHIGDSKSLRTCKVVNSSTFLDRLAFFQTVIYHTGKEW